MKNFPIAIFALTLGAFSIGMTEFVIMGLLPNVANDLHVSISASGQLITGYALGVAVGGPILTLSTGKMSRKRLLILLMILFVAGNAVAAVSTSYGLLMAARILTSFAHGTFFGVGAIMAARLVPKEKSASAISFMFTGLTVANVLGVPFGTFIGNQFGWRMSFLVIAVIGLISLIGIISLVPNQSKEEVLDIRNEVSVLKKPQVLVSFAMTIFGFAGVFTAFTYISPILLQVTGFQENGVTLILVLFGLGVTIGNLVGGKLADWKLMPSIIVSLILLMAVLLLFTITSEFKVPAVLTIFVWGIISFILVPTLQYRTMNMAHEAPTLASTLSHSAFNIGNAGGAALGGLAIEITYLQLVPLFAAAVTFIGLIITIMSYQSDKRTKRA
ncbi:MFS transporter [Bacillus sp. FSL M7-0558]|uniref:MFS transporter n=1 Tax=Bacillus sp. FSL M7-0558 TaxID=2921533 RepID=UPI0030FAD49C